MRIVVLNILNILLCIVLHSNAVSVNWFSLVSGSE